MIKIKSKLEKRDFENFVQLNLSFVDFDTSESILSLTYVGNKEFWNNYEQRIIDLYYGQNVRFDFEEEEHNAWENGAFIQWKQEGEFSDYLLVELVLEAISLVREELHSNKTVLTEAKAKVEAETEKEPVGV